MPARFEIRKVAPDQYRVRMTGKTGAFVYRLEMNKDAELENIKMEEEEWPPAEEEDKSVIEGWVGPDKWDSLRARNLKTATLKVRITERSRVRSFDAYFVDETVTPEKEELLAEDVMEYTWYVSPWANPTVRAGVGIVGVAVATGVISKWLGWW